jgi:hypothetical protein
LPVEILCTDAREFGLARRFALCIVPMQTVQLFGGREGRLRFLRHARAHLESEGLLAITVVSGLEAYDGLDVPHSPVPDMTEIDGVVYSSQPTAISSARGQFTLVRRRQRVDRDGQRSSWEDAIALDPLVPSELEREAQSVGLRLGGRGRIAATADYAGSEVVILRA